MIEWHAAQLPAMFLLGILGTGHCIGMCGPLVIALPGRTGLLRAHAAYHLGRILTYTAIGAVLGGIGSGSASPDLDSITPLGLIIGAAAALFLLLAGLNRLGLLPEPAWLSKADPRIIPGFGRLLRQSAGQNAHAAPFFLIGLVLGLLPCGLSYAAFARSLAAGGVSPGALTALTFGLGTLPGLLVLGTGAGLIFRRFRTQMELAAGLMMIWMGLSMALKLTYTLY